MFAQRRNRLTTHFSELIPVVKGRISLSDLVTVHINNATSGSVGTAVVQWLRCCATNLKVAGSIPAGVNSFFIDIKYFRSHYGPGVDSASNRNEYREYFLVVKAAGA